MGSNGGAPLGAAGRETEMIEILFLMYFSGKIAGIVKPKGYSPGIYQFLTYVFWFGGELLGAMVGASVTKGFSVYGFALAGAVIGAIAIYAIASGKRNLYREAFDAAS